MYGKIFEDLFCSTLMDYGGDTVYVFIAMIVLSNERGIIKHTPSSLARTICKDEETVRKALHNLEREDKTSNLKAHAGRRIVPLHELNEDETRGWLVVNKEVYRNRASKEEKKEADRKRIAENRKQNKGVADSRKESPNVADVAYTDTDTDTDTNNKKHYKGAVALPEWVPVDAWETWLEVRTKKRIPNTPNALRLALKELARLKANDYDPRVLLEQAAVRGWRGIFETKEAFVGPLVKVDL